MVRSIYIFLSNQSSIINTPLNVFVFKYSLIITRIWKFAMMINKYIYKNPKNLSRLYQLFISVPKRRRPLRFGDIHNKNAKNKSIRGCAALYKYTIALNIITPPPIPTPTPPPQNLHPHLVLLFQLNIQVTRWQLTSTGIRNNGQWQEAATGSSGKKQW